MISCQLLEDRKNCRPRARIRRHERSATGCRMSPIAQGTGKGQTQAGSTGLDHKGRCSPFTALRAVPSFERSPPAGPPPADRIRKKQSPRVSAHGPSCEDTRNSPSAASDSWPRDPNSGHTEGNRCSCRQIDELV